MTLVVAGCAALTAAAAAPVDPPPRSRLDVVTARGELRVCSTGDYPPFTHLDPETGEWSGIDVEMARDLAARLRVRATMVRTTWKTLTDDFVAGCDIGVGGISVTPERARKAAYSKHSFVDGKAPVARCADVDRFTTLDQIDQPGTRVVVNPGGTNEQFARANFRRAAITVHPDNTTIFDEILTGRADVMVTDAAEGRYQSRRRPGLCAVRPDEPFTRTEKAYLLPLGDAVFQRWVHQWLDRALHDGTYHRITTPWTG
ncbi:transporter substrate-binding domain-containing protein [Streptoalloteichus hindustanus]|uniref:transporter substrate-binding domain-containing protein n=1 Tax=Streptoalloteichus hindustanus TaxID=2017 RepID=UPI001F3AA107|nr:transporter substrate-binding domain-containing protein [Streptoalloteichus hindustanus]